MGALRNQTASNIPEHAGRRKRQADIPVPGPFRPKRELPSQDHPCGQQSHLHRAGTRGLCTQRPHHEVVFRRSLPVDLYLDRLRERTAPTLFEVVTRPTVVFLSCNVSEHWVSALGTSV